MMFLEKIKFGYQSKLSQKHKNTWKKQSFKEKHCFLWVNDLTTYLKNIFTKIYLLNTPLEELFYARKSLWNTPFNSRVSLLDLKYKFCQISILPSNIAWKEKSHYWCFVLLFRGFCQILGIRDPKWSIWWVLLDVFEA